MLSSVTLNCQVREILKKNWEKAVRLWGGAGGHPTPSLTASIYENLDPFLSYIKRQNNPKHGNLSRNVHIYLTASGEGVNPSGQPDRLFTVFFLRLPLAFIGIGHLQMIH